MRRAYLSRQKRCLDPECDESIRTVEITKETYDKIMNKGYHFDTIQRIVRMVT